MNAMRKMFARVALIALFSVGTPFVSGADEPPAVNPPPREEAKHTQDTLEMVKRNVELKKAILLDVREKDEWDEGHLEVARFTPLSKIREGLKPGALPKDKIVYLHCRSGGRVLIAQELLEKEGYDVRALKQGYRELLEGGFKKAE